MHKIVKINLFDINYDYRAASEIINKACNRREKMTVTGLSQVDNEILLSLETTKENDVKYIFSPFKSPATSEIVAEIRSRYDNNFTFLGSFNIDDTSWGLFRRNA